jgi:hypothetical protein
MMEIYRMTLVGSRDDVHLYRAGYGEVPCGVYGDIGLLYE